MKPKIFIEDKEYIKPFDDFEITWYDDGEVDGIQYWDIAVDFYRKDELVDTEYGELIDTEWVNSDIRKKDKDGQEYYFLDSFNTYQKLKESIKLFDVEYSELWY